MPQGLSLLLVVAGLIGAEPIDSQELPFAASDHYQAFLRPIYRGLERITELLQPSGITFWADGGGDGGGSDGGSGDSTGDGTGDSTGNGTGDATGDGDSSAADAAAVATTTTTTTDNSDPDADPTAVAPTIDPTNPAVNNPTNPTDPTQTESPLDAIQAIATTDPRGGFTPFDVPGAGVPGSGPGDGIPTAAAPSAPVDVAINAVIVSAAQSPWDAITKTPGVRYVIVTGGIIALGNTPIEGEVPGGGAQPAWLRLIPDLRLLNGSMIPPVVPNVIDIRILSCPIEIVDPPQGG
jgi:hypothetical protein